ncbi:HD domain-containing protein [Caloranaerobacter azorensis]|uniref:HD domain-containing protein n=1 Tax=Caloranaerobacter azorensis TaxID=116090 RepID=A0A6P1YEU5_9FIRM|nr:HD domain-containing protein [Caloranaerobacter azorensis]QIB26466.1 HD domain-containing protein [Caloranaerobacter azorensis]
MESYVLSEARKFLITYLKGKKYTNETNYPWRKDWEFVVYHSFRVESYVMKILKGEKQKISSEEVELLRIAAILHDIGRFDDRQQHAKVGAEIVKGWLDENYKISSQIKDVEKLLYMIETHSDKEKYEDDFCCKVLKDADILDEIGVLSIFMAANRVDNNSPFFFDQLLDRVRKFEIDFCDRKMLKLKTSTAKEILKKKKDFIISFTNQLEDELDGGEDILDLINKNEY